MSTDSKPSNHSLSDACRCVCADCGYRCVEPSVKETACAKLGVDPALFIDGAISDRVWTEIANG